MRWETQIWQTSLFIIDLDLRVRMITQYPCTVGHNYYEVGDVNDTFVHCCCHQTASYVHRLHKLPIKMPIFSPLWEEELPKISSRLRPKFASSCARDMSCDNPTTALEYIDSSFFRDDADSAVHRCATAGDLQPSWYARQLERRGRCSCRGKRECFVTFPSPGLIVCGECL